MANDHNELRPDREQDAAPKAGTQDLIHQHLRDEHHKFTDEDIRNVKVGVDDDPQPLGAAEIRGRFGEEAGDPSAEDDKPGSKPPNPWDVVK